MTPGATASSTAKHGEPAIDARSSLGEILRPRIAGLVVTGLTVGLLLVAWWLEPAGAGGSAMGTHQGLGMPPCGFLMTTGMPCATCGMTTAFALAADGRFVDALITQPLGAVLALLTAMLFWVGLWAAAVGADLSAFFARLANLRMVVLLVALVLGAWAYKIIATGAVQ